MIRRRDFLGTMLGGALAVSLAAAAQQPEKIRRIGFLSSASAEREERFLAAFRQGLRELGYVEGQTIVIEQRYGGDQLEKLTGLTAELVRLDVAILVVAGAPAAHAAKNAAGGIPIVMTNAADPVGTGLVASLARPGGNVTGLSDFTAGVVAKRLELLKEVVPAVSRVAILWNPTNPTNPPQLKLIQAAAPALGLTLRSFEARRADDIDRAFATISTERPGALIAIGDPLLGSHRRRIVELAAKGRLPAIYALREYADDGGLMSYGASFAHLYRRAASYVDKILKGAKPAELPVEQPTKFELVINLKAAEALGLTIPPSLLLRADQVLQ